MRNVAVPQGTVPPAVEANPLVLANGLAHHGGSYYHCCQTCFKVKCRQQRAKYQQPSSYGDIKARETIYLLDAGEVFFSCTVGFATDAWLAVHHALPPHLFVIKQQHAITPLLIVVVLF